MATGKRDVTLGIGVETTGEEGLRQLAGDVRGIGTAAESTAPDVAALARQLDALAAATRERRDAEASARTAATAARADLNAQADALARLRAGADAATRGTAEFAEREQALRAAVVEARIALRDKREALAAAGAEAKAAAGAERALADQIAQTQRATVAGNTAVGTSLDSLKGQLSALRNIATAALGGSIVGSLARDVAATADAYANLGARIKLATGEGQAFTQAFEGVQAIAQRTGATLDATGTLFARVLQAGKEMRLAQADALALTESITQAVQLSGASAESSDAAITQLIQGLQSGVLRGDEFNSVLEQAPRLSRALADGLSVTTGELRKMAEQGALTSEAVIRALQGQALALQAEFDKMPPTVERAMGRLASAWQVYVGHANEGSHATATAAGAIEALARNLGTVAELLFGAGKAAAAYAAVKLAASFFESATAARAAAAATTAATAATTAHTAAVTANTAAQGANTVAAAGAAAGAGRFAAMLGSIKLFALTAVLTNLESIGTAIGEGMARWAGYGKAIDEADAAAKREAETTRRNAAEKADLAQRTQQAADAALGLDKASKLLLADFDGVVSKTGDVADALEKVTKALKLGDLSGIAAAGAALDALAQRGKITALQVRDALAAALKTEDLVRFEAQARAAFDGSEQGARRLKAALDAVADEALRRAGTSAEELASGFSKAATSAVNDLDTLARTLRELKAPADEAGAALSTALDRALDAARTERAVQAVIDRIATLGREGQLSGDRVAEAMEKARAKLDQIKPGINSVAEALRTLGLKSQEEAQRTADSFAQAWARIRDDGTVALADKIKAFERYREAAIAANGGVESSELQLQRRILETEASVRGLGTTWTRSMDEAKRATDDASAALERQAHVAASLSDSLTKRNAAVRSIFDPEAGRYGADGFAKNADGETVSAGGQLQPPDSSGNWEFVGDVSPQAPSHAPSGSVFVPGVGYWKRKAGAEYGIGSSGGGLSGGGLPAGGWFVNGSSSATPAPAPAPNTTRSVNITINGQTTPVHVASDADASALESLLRQIGDAANRTGYGA